jgi:hypothetical protein
MLLQEHVARLLAPRIPEGWEKSIVEDDEAEGTEEHDEEESDDRSDEDGDCENARDESDDNEEEDGDEELGDEEDTNFASDNMGSGDDLAARDGESNHSATPSRPKGGAIKPWKFLDFYCYE